MRYHVKMSLCVHISFPVSKVESYNTLIYPRSSQVSVVVVIIKTAAFIIKAGVSILTKNLLNAA